MLRGRGLSYAMAYKTNVRAAMVQMQLGFFMLILVLILDVIFTFTGWDILYLFSFLLAVWCIWRIFSRNISRRYAENQKFMQVFSPVQNMIVSKISGARDPEDTSGIFAVLPANRKSVFHAEEEKSRLPAQNADRSLSKNLKSRLSFPLIFW